MRSYSALKRLNIGCGPHHARPEWWNVDLRPFPGVDEVRDVLDPWPWDQAELIYCEHFIEHLELDEALQFLTSAGAALRIGGRMRISTPNLTHVVSTHYHPTGPVRSNQRIAETIAINCAFRGWGHRFLWSAEMLEYVLGEVGFTRIERYNIGESDTEALRSLEQHLEHYVFLCGEPSVINVEASRGDADIHVPTALAARVEKELSCHIRSGH